MIGVLGESFMLALSRQNVFMPLLQPFKAPSPNTMPSSLVWRYQSLTQSAAFLSVPLRNSPK